MRTLAVEWTNAGQPGADRRMLRGDPTGASLLHVYRGGGLALGDPDPVALADAVVARGLPLTVSPGAVMEFLTLGLVPLPQSIFRECLAAGIGDRLELSLENDAMRCSHTVDFPYFRRNSRQDQPPDPGRLMYLLAASVERQLDGAGPAVLMLSSGKDSTAIAAALARLGRKDVRCLTFVANTDKDEDGYARALCRQLGLAHERVGIGAGQPVDDAVLTAYFRNAPLPCGDDCQIPYVMAMHHAGGAPAVLDGSGNDVYMGHVPSRNDRRRDRLRVRNRRLALALEAVAPFGTRADQLLRDPVEHCFLQGLFRQREVRRICPSAVGAASFRQPLLESYRHLDVFDFRALVRGRHYDQGSCALKSFMACAAAGSRCLLPWCDAGVVDYYFNLPEPARFDRRSFTNKVLLRETLRKEVGYPDAELGKRYFQFDRIAFFLANRKRVEDEVLGCRMWERAASESLLARMYGRLPRNPRVGVALNAWFLLSGWLNHNRWLNP